MQPEPTIDEIESIIARTEAIRAKWGGNPGYLRQLDVELHALNCLLELCRHRDRKRCRASQVVQHASEFGDVLSDLVKQAHYLE